MWMRAFSGLGAGLLMLMGLLAGCGGDDTPIPAGARGSVEGRVFYIDPTDGGRATRAAAELPISGATVAIDGDKGISATTDAAGVFHLDNVPAGRVTITITHQQFSEPATITANVGENTTTDVGGAEMGVVYCIGVGVAEYLNLPAADYLVAPPKDVQRFEQSLFSAFQGTRVSYINSAATKSAVRGAVQTTAAQMRARDMLIFYYSGHGTSHALAQASGMPQTWGWYDIIVPYDSDPTTYALDITDTELRDWLSGMPDPQRAVVILDTCGSGAFFDGADSTRARAADLPEEHMRALRRTGCTVIAASAPNESSWENASGGIFSYCAYQGLTTGKTTADSNHDRKITAEELYTYAADRTLAARPDQHAKFQAGRNPVLLRY